jgi:hypothetical protein
MILAPPLSAEWLCKVYSPKGEWLKEAKPHPLSYFIQDPVLRDDANDFCKSCTPEEKATIHLKMKARSEVRRLGLFGGFIAYDVLFYFQDSKSPDWKFVLLKTGPDEYRKIVQIQRTQHDQYVGPSHIVTCGKEQFLVVRAHAGGNGGVYYGDYFWFGQDGPIVVDVDGPIMKASISAIPKGKVSYGTVGVDFETLTATVPLVNWNERWPGGAVEVRFRCDREQIIPSGARYIDDEQ